MKAVTVRYLELDEEEIYMFNVDKTAYGKKFLNLAYT